MTKYILNSGGIRNSADKGARFYNEIVRGLGSRPRVLLCHFAQPREDWEIKFPEYVEAFRSVMPADVQPTFEMAFPDTFVEQLKESDAVYFHGGDDHLIQYWLHQFQVPRIWEGKVVATNSASSHALVSFFWTCDWRRCMKGLGILPIKFLAHFESAYGHTDPRGPIDWSKARRELAEYGDVTLPVCALHEGEYQVIEA